MPVAFSVSSSVVFPPTFVIRYGRNSWKGIFNFWGFRYIILFNQSL